MSQAFKVKPLVWRELAGGNATAPFPLLGTIFVAKSDGGFRVMWSLPGRGDTFTPGRWATLEAAKAAAQADYEARIMSAIDVQPDPRDEVIARLVEALEGYKSRANRVPFDLAMSSDAALAAAKAVTEHTDNKP